MNFEGKHIVVTGGANGIGKCITKSFIQAGAVVTVIDIDELFKDDKINFYYGDISEKSTLEAFVESLDTSVDCLINNACSSRKGILSDCSYEDFIKTVNLRPNLKGRLIFRHLCLEPALSLQHL